jgi:hypothetical protein
MNKGFRCNGDLEPDSGTKLEIMMNMPSIKKIINIAAFILIVWWVVAFFSHSFGPFVHGLFLAAMILLIFNTVHDDNPDTPEKI